jgi:hypothetical protein
VTEPPSLGSPAGRHIIKCQSPLPRVSPGFMGQEEQTRCGGTEEDKEGRRDVGAYHLGGGGYRGGAGAGVRNGHCSSSSTRCGRAPCGFACSRFGLHFLLSPYGDPGPPDLTRPISNGSDFRFESIFAAGHC